MSFQVKIQVDGKEVSGKWYMSVSQAAKAFKAATGPLGAGEVIVTLYRNKADVAHKIFNGGACHPFDGRFGHEFVSGADLRQAMEVA